MERWHGSPEGDARRFVPVHGSLLIGLPPGDGSMSTWRERTQLSSGLTITFYSLVFLGYLLYILDPYGYASVYGWWCCARFYCWAWTITSVVSIPCFWCNDHYYCTITYYSLLFHLAFLVLCDGDCDGAFYWRSLNTLFGVAQRMKNDKDDYAGKVLAISGIILPCMLPQEPDSGY